MTVELQDFTSAKRTERVKVPLNGVNYWGVPELAADYVVELMNATGGGRKALELPPGFTMDDLADLTPEKQAELAEVGGGMLAAMVGFFVEALEPDSWETFRENMKRPPKKGITPAERRKRDQRLITWPQFQLVFKAMLTHYMGRPTTPSDSSSNGSGGTGGTSTAGARAAE